MRRALAAAVALAVGLGAVVATQGQDGDGEPPADGEVTGKRREWFVEHQSPDGSWSPQGYRQQCTGEGCDGPGAWQSETGATGLVLLAFLGYGETYRSPRYGHCIRDAARHLKETQDADGCFGVRYPDRFVTDHAIATLAMCELYGMTQSLLFRESAKRGIAFLLSRRNPDGGWGSGDYSPASEVPTTAWAVMVLRSARNAGFEVPDDAFPRALAFLDLVTDPETGLVRRDQGEALSFVDGAGTPTIEVARWTAQGTLARVLCGVDREDPLVGKAMASLASVLPRREAEPESFDPEYWYFAKEAWDRTRGVLWGPWDSSMRVALIDSQVLDSASCRYGSWDPVGGHAAEIGRVATTAHCVMCLEVYYRYARVFGSRSPQPATAETTSHEIFTTLEKETVGLEEVVEPAVSPCSTPRSGWPALLGLLLLLGACLPWRPGSRSGPVR